MKQYISDSLFTIELWLKLMLTETGNVIPYRRQIFYYWLNGGKK